MSKFIKVVAMGDNHGNHADPDTLKAIQEFCADFKPDFRIHGGDNWDLACLRKGVREDEKEASRLALAEDVEAGCDWVSRYRPTHFIKGNHDWRIDEHIRKTDSIENLAAYERIRDKMHKSLRQSGCKVVKPYTVQDGVVSVGPLDFAHSFYAGQDAALKMAHRFNRTPGGGFTIFHLHRAEQYNLERSGGGAVWICGAACRLDMEYAEKNPSSLRWQNSFMAYLIKDGQYIGRQAHRFAGKWIMPFSE